MDYNVLRIVPAASDHGGAMPTLGTKVLMPDGQEIPRVAKIELTAEPNGVWRARITCNVIVAGDIIGQLLTSDNARLISEGEKPQVMANDQLTRIERSIEEIKMVLGAVQANLSVLVESLADEDDMPAHDLDGNDASVERAPGQSLG